MCGIVGYIGSKRAQPILLNCLGKLEYRGYDSCGIAIAGDAIEVFKDAVRVKVLAKALPPREGVADTQLSDKTKLRIEGQEIPAAIADSNPIDGPHAQRRSPSVGLDSRGAAEARSVVVETSAKMSDQPHVQRGSQRRPASARWFVLRSAATSRTMDPVTQKYVSNSTMSLGIPAGPTMMKLETEFTLYPWDSMVFTPEK